MALEDRLVGSILLCISVAVFAYYSVWVIIMPFVDVGHPAHSWFPARELAITIPLVLILLVLFVILTFLSLVMIKSQKKKTN